MSVNRIKFSGSGSKMLGGRTTSPVIGGSGVMGGNAATATITDESADALCYPVFVTDATGNVTLHTNSTFTFNSSTNNLIIEGPLTATGVGYGGGANFTISVAAGYAIALDGHTTFDGAAIGSLTNNNTVWTAYAGKNITIETVTFDGGVVGVPTKMGIGVAGASALHELDVRGTAVCSGDIICYHT